MRTATMFLIATLLSTSVTLADEPRQVKGEVIVIQDRVGKPAPPKPKNFEPTKTPPYSDAAVLSDAWTKAHMLLDVDEAGVVRRYKFLKRPGYDLEKIAAQQVTRLTFDPARDASGRPKRSWVVWTIEWPSAGWLESVVGTRSRMPPLKGVEGRRADHYIPCKDSGRPWAFGSVKTHPVYKDCSTPDLRKASSEMWIDVK